MLVKWASMMIDCSKIWPNFHFLYLSMMTLTLIPLMHDSLIKCFLESFSPLDSQIKFNSLWFLSDFGEKMFKSLLEAAGRSPFVTPFNVAQCEPSSTPSESTQVVPVRKISLASTGTYGPHRHSNVWAHYWKIRPSLECLGPSLIMGRTITHAWVHHSCIGPLLMHGPITYFWAVTHMHGSFTYFWAVTHVWPSPSLVFTKWAKLKTISIEKNAVWIFSHKERSDYNWIDWGFYC